jgi:hypothetical protein
VIYIVAGMHRSGTSMLAGLLHRNGISMGRQFRRALPENPRGFFEEEAFRRANDRALRSSGYVVEEWNPSFTGVMPTVEDEELAKTLLSEFGVVSDSWGWKDPRTCLTLKMWLGALDALALMKSTRIIVIRRDMWSVARSLRSRGNVKSLGHGAAIWRMYNHHLERSLLEHAVCPPVLNVRYERLIQQLDVDRLESFCDRKLDTSFIDSSLNRSDKDFPAQVSLNREGRDSR